MLVIVDVNAQALALDCCKLPGIRRRSLRTLRPLQCRAMVALTVLEGSAFTLQAGKGRKGKLSCGMSVWEVSIYETRSVVRVATYTFLARNFLLT